VNSQLSELFVKIVRGDLINNQSHLLAGVLLLAKSGLGSFGLFPELSYLVVDLPHPQDALDLSLDRGRLLLGALLETSTFLILVSVIIVIIVTSSATSTSVVVLSVVSLVVIVSIMLPAGSFKHSFLVEVSGADL
jgi:hypothetical protein